MTEEHGVVHVVMSAGALGADEHDRWLDQSMRELAILASTDPDGEWAGKYGTTFENDVFLMRPYCWCDLGDCPWCTACTGDIPDVPHGGQCYQSRLGLLRQEHGEWEPWGWSVPYRGSRRQEYDNAKRALCEEMGVSYEAGNEVHCTCAAESEQERLYAACQCDWHLGRGPFRFGAAQDAPNFWHKPSGFRVRWYKYIGRGMKAETEPDDLAAVLEECRASIGVAS